MIESKNDIIGESEILTLEEFEFVLPEGVNLKIVANGPKFQSRKNGDIIEILVNSAKFRDLPQACRFGGLKLAQTTQLKRSLQKDAKGLMKTTKSNSGIARILQLKGLKNIKSDVPKLIQKITEVDVAHFSLTEAFDYACEYYVLTGSLPENLSQEVASAINLIPKIKKGPHKGLHILDALVSEKYSHRVEQRLFQKIARIRKKLKEKEVTDTEKFEYKPQIGAEESEPINPESIETKVTPFYGGYYRGYACNFDPDRHQIIQESGYAQLFEPDEEIDTEKLKKYVYETVYDPAKDNLIEIPYNSVPLVHTVKPNSIKIYRADNGSFYLQSQSTKEEKQKISFEFVILKTQDNVINDEPGSQNEVWGGLDSEAETFLDSIKNQPLSKLQKARKCAMYTRKRFKYPEDENARAEMNSKYLATGANALKAMCKYKVADCYWSNIFCGQLLARLNVNHRVIAGHYVQKDPRFDFAAVEGIGHAWSEIWDENSWQRLDATPAKEENEEKKEESQDEELDGDFGENAELSEEPQEELSIEEIRALFEELLNEESSPVNESSPDELFEENTGVSLQKWKAVERYIKAINKTEIPPKSSINGKESTIEKEWDQLFNLIYKRREVPVEAFRGPVRQSEGDELNDPVDAVIDVLSGESDPIGYKLRHQKTKEHVDVTSFEDDSILDLTGSMSGTPAEEQKKMILSGLYNLMMLSRRLGLDKYKRKMRDPLELKSRIFTFKGSTQVDQVLDSEDIIDEKSLCRLYDELEKTKAGGGNLVGALRAYESALTNEQIKKIKDKKLVKVLTIVSDGVVGNTGEAVKIIKSLREKGIVVQGIGFGDHAQDIKVICHNPDNPKAGEVIDDVTKAVSVRHGMLKAALKGL